MKKKRRGAEIIEIEICPLKQIIEGNFVLIVYFPMVSE
jgi:hypothetical protein